MSGTTRRRAPGALLLAAVLAMPAAFADTACPADRAADPATDDVAYLTQIGLIRGHLLVGLALLGEGHADHAKRHMKHPADELYAGLSPAFRARGAAGFADELEQLALRVERDAPTAEIDAAWSALNARMREAAAAAGEPDDSARRRIVANLLCTAAEEYGIGVVDGRVREVHEFQDAWGFTQAARSRLGNGLQPLRPVLEALDPLWPALVPAERVEGDATWLRTAAGRAVEPTP